jgi:hypothetical protein
MGNNGFPGTIDNLLTDLDSLSDDETKRLLAENS